MTGTARVCWSAGSLRTNTARPAPSADVTGISRCVVHQCNVGCERAVPGRSLNTYAARVI